jgi:hypothetical protein
MERLRAIGSHACACSGWTCRATTRHALVFGGAGGCLVAAQSGDWGNVSTVDGGIEGRAAICSL